MRKQSQRRRKDPATKRREKTQKADECDQRLGIFEFGFLIPQAAASFIQPLISFWFVFMVAWLFRFLLLLAVGEDAMALFFEASGDGFDGVGEDVVVVSDDDGEAGFDGS